MNEDSTPKNTINNEFNLKTEDIDYINLITRLKEIKITIAALEKIFK